MIMKRLLVTTPTPVDVFLIAYTSGAFLGLLVRLLVKQSKKNSNEDPIVQELQKESSFLLLSPDKKPINVPLIRGGDDDTVK